MENRELTTEELLWKDITGLVLSSQIYDENPTDTADKIIEIFRKHPSGGLVELDELCKALGWQGGTIHQVVEEVKQLKEKAWKYDQLCK